MLLVCTVCHRDVLRVYCSWQLKAGFFFSRSYQEKETEPRRGRREVPGEGERGAAASVRGIAPMKHACNQQGQSSTGEFPAKLIHHGETGSVEGGGASILALR